MESGTNYVSKHAIDQSHVESMQNHMDNVLCELGDGPGRQRTARWTTSSSAGRVLSFTVIYPPRFGEDALINTGLLSIMIEAVQN